MVLLGGSLLGCVQHPRPVPVGNDRTVRFPQFFEQEAIAVGGQGPAYELDGVVLQAVMIAANDFLPPSTQERPCWDRPEAHQYRVIRQADVIFVRIDENPAFCSPGTLSLDSGAKYAISTDGRILRRVVDGEPDDSFGPASPLDAGSPASSDAGTPAMMQPPSPNSSHPLDGL
jgi:hypothetical protein